MTAGFSKLALLAVEVVLARGLGVEDFGNYAVASSLVIVISSTAVLGMDHGAVQLMTRPNSGLGDRQIVRTAVLFSASAAIVFAGAVAAFADPLASMLFGSAGASSVLRLAAVAAIFETINNVLASALRVHHRYALSIGVFDGIRNVTLGLGVLAALGASSPEETIAFFAGGSAMGSVVGIIAMVRRTSSQPTPGHARPLTELWRFSRSLSVWGILQLSSTQLYVVVAGFILAPREVSALAIGLRVVILLNFLRTSFTASIQRELVVRSHAGQYEAMQRILTTVSMTLLVSSGLLCLPFLIGPGTIMRAFGGEWVQYGWILWPLLIPKLINVGAGPVGQALIATGNGSRLLRLAVLEMSMQFAVLVPCMIVFGLAGAIVGEALRVLVMFCARHLVLHRAVGIRSFTRSHEGVLVALGGGVAAGAALYALLGGLPGYIISVAISLLVVEVLIRVLVTPPTSPLMLGLRLLGAPRGLPGARKEVNR